MQPIRERQRSWHDHAYMEETLPDPLGGNKGPGLWQWAEAVGE